MSTLVKGHPYQPPSQEEIDAICAPYNELTEQLNREAAERRKFITIKSRKLSDAQFDYEHEDREGWATGDRWNYGI